MHIKFNSSYKPNPRNMGTNSFSNRQDFKGQCENTVHQPQSKPPQPSCEKPLQAEPCQNKNKEKCNICENKAKAMPMLKLPFCTLYSEDILLLALIMVLINENCDEILLLALVYIFVSGLEK